MPHLPKYLVSLQPRVRTIKNRPDLTHIRVVKEGDTLPSMANDIYGDFSYYLEVAKANNLQDFRNLIPGQKLYFPPFDKNVKKPTNA